MANNVFNNEVRIAKRAMAALENNLVLSKHVSTSARKEYEHEGAAKNGETIYLRVPGTYKVRHGAAADPQGFNETTVPLAVSQHGVDLELSSRDYLLFMEDGEAFTRNVIEPMVAPLASYIDQAGMNLWTGITQVAGVPGTRPTDLSSFLDAKAYLNDSSTPITDQLFAIVGSRSEASIVNGLKGLFQSSSQIEKQYEDGTMGRAAGFKFSMSQNVPSMVVGTFGTSTPLMNGTTADGASTLVTNGWASGASTLKVGDSLSVDGVFSVNPVSKQATTTLKQFVVTEQISDTTGGMTIKISPTLVLSGPTQNVSALPVNSAKVYVYGANANTYSGKTSEVNIVAHRDAFELVSLNMPKLDSAYWCERYKLPGLNLSARFVKALNAYGDKELIRMDVMFGWALKRPNFACRVQG